MSSKIISLKKQALLIAAAQACGYGDFFNQTGEDFAALCVGSGFFVLDVCPLAVSGHNRFPFKNKILKTARDSNIFRPGVRLARFAP